MGIQLKPVDDIRAPGCTLGSSWALYSQRSQNSTFFLPEMRPQRSLGFLRDAGQHVGTLQLLRRLNFYSAEADVEVRKLSRIEWVN